MPRCSIRKVKTLLVLVCVLSLTGCAKNNKANYCIVTGHSYYYVDTYVFSQGRYVFRDSSTGRMVTVSGNVTVEEL